jgi:Protein of unknown function (DUF3616)
VPELPVLQPKPLTISPPLDDEDERNNLSGAACNPHGVCLMIGDEKRYARFFTVEDDRLRPAARLHLLPRREHGAKMAESDGEGVAYADGFFYLVGSHSRDRDGAAQASRHFLFRIPGHQKTPPDRDIGDADAPSAGIERATLDAVIAAHPLLREHLADTPGDTPDGSGPSHGVNIEGLAMVGGDMFVGFRGPVDDKGALVLRLNAAALLGGKARPRARSFRLALGTGQGIRDMAAVADGILILSGPERRTGVAPDPELFLWRPGRAPRRLARLAPTAGTDNPESITVLKETKRAWRLLVLWDGPGGGLPMVVRLQKPGPANG